MAPLPRPMKAVTGPLPHDEEDGWAFEVKWDGMRVVAGVDGIDGTLRAESTRGLDVVARFPEMEGLVGHLSGHTAVLDGEVVATDGARSDFALLQQRMHVSSRAEALRRAAQVPVCFVVFDLLGLDGVDTTGLAYLDRRRLLTDLVEDGPGWQVPAHRIGDGSALFEAARSLGLEGVVAKRTASRYEPGRRSPSWRKVKVRLRQEFVVAGWTEGTGRRAGALGALLVGVHDDGPDGLLRFAGAVGTGFDDAELDVLTRLLAAGAVPDAPFAGGPPPGIRAAGWVRPDIVVEVAFAEWTPDGKLRHPSYLGRRIDVDPGAVVRETGI